MGVPLFDDAFGERFESVNLSGHGVHDMQPAEPISDLRWLRLPDRIVVGPDAADHLPAAKGLQSFLDPGFGRAKRPRGSVPPFVQFISLFEYCFDE